jgi:transaldolase
MKKAGITDYERFAKTILELVTDKPISFEVFSEEFDEMYRQALKLHSWQHNVYVKVPITNSRAEPALPIIQALADKGVKVNVTAVLTAEQVKCLARVLHKDVASIVSVFAGRIADTGVDPVPVMRTSLETLSALPKAELLWASVREVLNIRQAAECGCHIVTVPHDILRKAETMWGKDHSALSLETVKMFADDARSCAYSL